MTMKNSYKHWKPHLDNQGVLWFAIDRQGSKVNSLNQEVLQELDIALDEMATNTAINSVIFYSAKSTGFIVGADVSQFTQLKSSEEAFSLIRQGQLVFDKLAALTKPTVAMIDGYCLGGGLEFALACRHRVAEDSHHTRLGLPEVLLGLQPGWGGTVRLPTLIGAPQAMRLITTGKIISAQEALKLGMVDVAVPKRVLNNAALHYALSHQASHRPSFVLSLTNHGFVRPILAKLFNAKLKEKIQEEHYPAPFAVIRDWEEYGPAHPQAMLQEARSIAELMVHPTGRNLLRVFFLKERLKSLAKGLKFKAQHVHVIGAGTMGSAIAAWCALSGMTVTLKDRTPKLIAAGLKQASHIFQSRLRDPRELLLTKDRLTADIEGAGLAKADVIIEAIVENLAAKHLLYREIEDKIKPNALLATNTSSLPLSELGKVLQSPERLVGIHFFNPVDKMELVEVVSDSTTNTQSVNDAIAFVKQINRLPLPVQSKPGFLVNRILMPYLMESMLLLQEGVSAQQVDQAAKNFGMPMGPIELSDRVGLDVCLQVADILTSHLGGEVPEALRSMVAAGKLGAKSGEGFYKYHAGKIQKATAERNRPAIIPETDIIDRLILRMVNEACLCLRESVVSDADLLDAGMIFGTGFAPFRGGPMHYAKTRGFLQIHQRLEQLATQYGDRFQPDIGWKVDESASPEEEVLPHGNQPDPDHEARVH